MDEQTQFNREEKGLEDLANDALDEACAYIQKKLGVTTGDFASHFFSDGVVVGLFQKYIDEEVYLNVLNKDQLNLVKPIVIIQNFKRKKYYA